MSSVFGRMHMVEQKIIYVINNEIQKIYVYSLYKVIEMIKKVLQCIFGRTIYNFQRHLVILGKNSEN